MEPSNFETGLNVLVVDDNDCVREVLTTLRKKLIEKEKARRAPNVLERGFTALFRRKLYDVY